MKYFFKTFIPNIVRIFSPYNILWHLLAIVSTYSIVTTNTDWNYFLISRNITLNTIFFPAIIIGGLLPIIIPLSLIAVGIMRRTIRTTIIGFAFAQAVILGSLISSTYKAFTGRIQPNIYNLVVDGSHQFNFGFFKHGIFWGWPSSHTTIAFAMALTFVHLFPKSKTWSYSAILYAFYIGIGVSLSIHWFSEFIAGAIIGSVIGVVVGKSFYTLLTHIPHKEVIE